jgi:hypothetical protein
MPMNILEMLPGRRLLPRSRLMTAVFLLFNAGMLWWFLAERGRFARCSPEHCPSALKLAFVVTSWAFGALFISMLWLAVERRLGLRDLARSVPRRADQD